MPKPEELAQLVFFVRDEKVMFDSDLAKLYGVRTRALNQALRRNKNRFPEDFAFQLTRKEFDAIRSQIVTASPGYVRCGHKLRSHPGAIFVHCLMPLPNKGSRCY